jgi:FAD dependent oxidoreductase
MARPRFHPRMYLAGLVRAIQAAGGRIYEHSEVGEFCDEPLSVKANDCTITCSSVLIATHTPLTGNKNIVLATLFQTKLALYTSYVIAGQVPSDRVPDALFSDTADPYHYLRVHPGHNHDIIIFGGEDHKTGQATDTNACYSRLERELKALVPAVRVTHHWSGQVIETHDGLPYLGRNKDHQYIATGFAGNGMTFGTLGAMIAADGILGRTNPWAELFDTGRTKIRHGVWDYITENKDYPYYLIRDRFAGAEGRTLRSGEPRRGEDPRTEWCPYRCVSRRHWKDRPALFNVHAPRLRSWPGTTASGRGIARATGRGSDPTATFLRGPRNRRSLRSKRPNKGSEPKCRL